MKCGNNIWLLATAFALGGALQLGCSEPNSQTITGEIGIADFPGEVLGVRAVRGTNVIASSPLQASRFDLEIPTGNGYHLEIVTKTGVHPLVRGHGYARFDICEPGLPHDVGSIHYAEDPCEDDPEVCDPCLEDPEACEPQEPPSPCDEDPEACEPQEPPSPCDEDPEACEPQEPPSPCDEDPEACEPQEPPSPCDEDPEACEPQEPPSPCDEDPEACEPQEPPSPCDEDPEACEPQEPPSPCDEDPEACEPQEPPSPCDEDPEACEPGEPPSPCDEADPECWPEPPLPCEDPGSSPENCWEDDGAVCEAVPVNFGCD